MASSRRLLWIPLTLAAAGAVVVAAYFWWVGAGWQTFIVFPRLAGGERGRLGAAGAILPDPAAPACPASDVPSESWPARHPQIATELVREVTLRLPAAYLARPLALGPGDAPPPTDHILGLWEVYRPGTAPPVPESELALWLSSRDGYPTVGASPRARQLTFRECRSSAGARTVSLAEFTLATPDGARHYVAAVWRVRPGLWLTALGSGRTPAARAELHAALETLRFTVPPR